MRCTCAVAHHMLVDAAAICRLEVSELNSLVPMHDGGGIRLLDAEAPEPVVFY